MINLIVDTEISALLDPNWFCNKLEYIESYFRFDVEVRIVSISSLVEFTEMFKVDCPEWVVAATIGTNVYLINHVQWMGKYSVEQIVIHELIHALVNYRSIQMPLPLYEGLALYFADQIDTQFNNVMNLDMNEIECLSYKDAYFYEYAGLYTLRKIENDGLDGLIRLLN